MWASPKSRPPIMALTLSHSLALWDKLSKLRSITSVSKHLAHLFNNPDFPPGLNVVAFKWWLEKGLYRIGHFFLLQVLSISSTASTSWSFPRQNISDFNKSYIYTPFGQKKHSHPELQHMNYGAVRVRNRGGEYRSFTHHW